MKKSFNAMDLNWDGLLSKDELRIALADLDESLNDSEADAMINMVDEDGNGHIDFEEFCNAAKTGTVSAMKSYDTCDDMSAVETEIKSTLSQHVVEEDLSFHTKASSGMKIEDLTIEMNSDGDSDDDDYNCGTYLRDDKLFKSNEAEILIQQQVLINLNELSDIYRN